MLPSTKINYNAKLINRYLVEIKPLGLPLGQLHYMDFTCRNLLKERKDKIAKIIERMIW